MPPAVVYHESDLEAFQQYHRDELPTGESWEEELVEPGYMQYVGQGQMMFLRISEVEPGIVWPKRKKKKKKKKSSSSPPSPTVPESAPAPAPIDWGDWEELCQAAPPQSPPEPDYLSWEPEEVPWEPEEVPWEPEDWDAELASQSETPWQPEDWEVEIAVFQTNLYLREDWETELASQWEPEDWESELSQ
jgi:hypothetical protein